MMRGQKKFIYGLFYLLVLATIVWAFWPSAKVPVPPVCSGPSCGTSQPLPLQVSGVPQMFASKITHRVVLLGQVTNPNSDYGASAFSYQFYIFDRNGKTISLVPGNGVIYPSETKYILGVYDAGSADLSSIAERPGFEINNASLEPAGNFLKPDLALSSGPSVQLNADSIVVSGTLKNQGSSLARNVSIIALLSNKYSDPLFAAQTLISNLAGFEEIAFQIPFPADQQVVESVATDKTQVFLSTE